MNKPGLDKRVRLELPAAHSPCILGLRDTGGGTPIYQYPVFNSIRSRHSTASAHRLFRAIPAKERLPLPDGFLNSSKQEVDHEQDSFSERVANSRFALAFVAADCCQRFTW